jgi:hypothetical protein
MKPWRYHPKALENRLSLVRFVKSEVDFSELRAVAHAVFTALWPVVQPLSVDLTLAARSPREFPYINRKIPVPVRNWHLLAVDTPAHVAIPTWAEAEWANPSQYSEEAIPELTPQALADWLARAHAQQLPEGYVPVLETMEMHDTRARLLQDQKPSAQLTWGQKTHAVPVEQREDGLWVSGPMREAMINHSPIEVTLTNFHGRLDLDIAVYWSPWIEKGATEEEVTEADLLLACLYEPIKQGWEAD